MEQGPLAELAGGLCQALTMQPKQAELGTGIARQAALQKALAAAFPRAARCSVEVIAGRKVFIATACSGSVRQPLVQIRDRGSAQDAQACSLSAGAAPDTLRTGVPLARPGRWRPFRRHSADWLSDTSSSSAVLYLQLAAPHAGFTPQDVCVLEGLAALLGMQLAPVLPLLRRGPRRGAGSRSTDAAIGSQSAESESRAERVRRRSSEFVIHMKRKSGTFLRLISLGNDGPSPAGSFNSRRRHSHAGDSTQDVLTPLRSVLSAEPTIPEDQPAVLARPCSAPSAMAMDGLLAAQAPLGQAGGWPRPIVRDASMTAGAPRSLPAGGAYPPPPPAAAPSNPFTSAASNPFATAPPRAGGQPWSGPAAANPTPFASAKSAGPFARLLVQAGTVPLAPLPPAAETLDGQPPNPFATMSRARCDWDFMERPNQFEGDGFDSDTTDFCSRAAHAPFARSGGLGLFATDDQVWLPGNMVWDGQVLQHRNPLPLPATCGLTAAAAGTIRREGVVQSAMDPRVPPARGLDAFAHERQVRVDRWTAEHAITHSPRQLSEAFPGAELRSLAAPAPALEADLALRQFQRQLQHRRLSLERRRSGDQQRASLEAPGTPPAAPPPPLPAAANATPVPAARVPGNDLLQRVIDRVETRVMTSPRSSHRRSISKPGKTAVPAVVTAASEPAAARAQPLNVPALQHLLQHTQPPSLHGLEAFLLAAISGWVIYSVAHEFV